MIQKWISRVYLQLRSSPQFVLEREDLFLLFLCSILVPLTWLVCFGWKFGDNLSVHDGISYLQPYLIEFSRVDGDWRKFLYRLVTLGGTAGQDAVGIIPIFRISSHFHFSSVTSEALLILFIQGVYGFFGLRTALNLSTAWGNNPWRELNLIALVSGILLCAFSPVIGWRMAMGHEPLFIGFFPYFISVGLLSSGWVGRFSVVQVLLGGFALWNAFTSVGQQGVLYSVVFGGPVLVSFLPRLNRKGWMVICLIVLGAFAISMEQFRSMAQYVSRGDAGRGIGGTDITYSYVTGNIWDWLTSIPWSMSWIKPQRQEIYWHEVNYPLGPFLLLAIGLLPWRRARSFALGLMVCFVLSIIFSNNLEPISTLLIRIVMPLKSFRVPERSFICFATLLPVVGLSVVFYHFAKPVDIFESRKSLMADSIASAIGLILLLVIPEWAREIPLWFLALFLMIAVRIPVAILFVPAFLKRLTVGTLLFLFCVGSLSAFQERLHPFSSFSRILSGMTRLGEQLRQQVPALSNPLNRAHLTFDLAGVGASTGNVLGISSLNGYSPPFNRFIQLMAGIEKVPPNPTTIYVQLNEASPTFQILRQLYNVQYLIRAFGETFHFESTGPTAGAAWFAGDLKPVGSFNELGQKLLDQKDSLYSQVRDTSWFVSEDSATAVPELAAWTSGGSPNRVSLCRHSTVTHVDARLNDPIVQLGVKVMADCPLIIATNFFTKFEAYSIQQGRRDKRLTVFPAMGALTGIIIPSGTEEIWVEAIERTPAWVYAVEILGWLCWIAALGVVLRFIPIWRPRGVPCS